MSARPTEPLGARWSRAVVSVLVTVAVAIMMSWAAGSAAAAPAAVTPGPGAVLADPPAAVRVVMSSPVEPALARARVEGPGGASSSVVRAGDADPEALVIPVPQDGMGTYAVAWSGLTRDGHPFAGQSTFAVGTATPVAAAVAPEGGDGTGPPGIIARFLVLVGALGTAGLAFGLAWVVGGALRSGGIAPPGVGGAERLRAAAQAAAAAPSRRLWATWWALLAVWVGGLALALPVQAAAVGGEWADLLWGSRWGTAWVGLAVLSVAAAAAGIVVRGGDPTAALRSPRMYALAVPGIAAAVIMSWSGHAGSGTDAGLGVAIDSVHGWATAAWLGGLVMLLVFALPLLGAMARDARVRLGAGILVRFSSLAIAAVVVLVITGVYRALAELPTLSALWTSGYGMALLVKMGIFAVMLGMALWNRLVLHPRLERAALGVLPPGKGDGLPALRASVRGEVVLAGLVMAAVAVLVGIPPPV